MLEYFKQNPLQVVILAALAALTVFVCLRAAAASKKKHGATNDLIKKLEEENKLRNEFAILTEKTARDADPERLFKGVALNLHKKVEKQPDMIEAFDSLTQAQRNIYAFYFVLDDGAEKLSNFFKINGAPLTTTAKIAVNELYTGEICEVFNAEYAAFDGDNEDVSFIPDEIAALDEKFKRITESTNIFTPAANYIIANIDKFI